MSQASQTVGGQLPSYVRHVHKCCVFGFYLNIDQNSKLTAAALHISFKKLPGEIQRQLVHSSKVSIFY